MFTHKSGRRVWDVMFDVARAGNWAIMPVGCPTCVPMLSMIAELPDELRSDAVVVNSAAKLLDAVLRSETDTRLNRRHPTEVNGANLRLDRSLIAATSDVHPVIAARCRRDPHWP